jgi:hypothetical protein
MAFVLTVMLIVSPVRYTDLSVVSDSERYDVWKTALPGLISSPDRVAFAIIGTDSSVGESKTIA